MKLLYLVSSPHGGSTLLSLVLARHSAASNLGEFTFMPKVLANRESCTCGVPVVECPHFAKLFAAIRDRCAVDLTTAPYDLYLGDAIKDRHGSGLVDEKYQTSYRKLAAKLRGAADTAALLGTRRAASLRLLTPRAINKAVANTLLVYRLAAQAWGNELLVDASKLPRMAPRVYLEAPDEVRVLHLVRDSRSVVTSRMRYMGPERAARRWNHYHSVAVNVLDRWVAPEARRRLRYEDFVAAPERELRALCDWLELEYEDSMLDFSIPVELHSSGGNPARFDLSKGIHPAEERWRTQLSAEQLAAVMRRTGELNRRFGYE
ncbi:MAG: sulfotransferase family protein [Gammaproteobacteria bacterium]